MKTVLTLSERVEVPIEFLYDVMTQLQQFEKWKPGLIRVDILSGHPSNMDEYSMWREKRMLNGVLSSEVYEVISLVPISQITLKINGWKGTSAKGQYFFYYKLTGKPEATDLTLTHEIILDGIYGLFTNLLLGFKKRVLKEDLTKLKLFAEARFNESIKKNNTQ